MAGKPYIQTKYFNKHHHVLSIVLRISPTTHPSSDVGAYIEQYRIRKAIAGRYHSQDIYDAMKDAGIDKITTPNKGVGWLIEDVAKAMLTYSQLKSDSTQHKTEEATQSHRQSQQLRHAMSEHPEEEPAW